MNLKRSIKLLFSYSFSQTHVGIVFVVVILVLLGSGAFAYSRTVQNTKSNTHDAQEANQGNTLVSQDAKSSEVVNTANNGVQISASNKADSREKNTTVAENNSSSKTETRDNSTACFQINSDYKYNETTYYAGKVITLDASCSSEIVDYQWYLAGISFGSGEVLTKNISYNQQINTETEIKLIATSKNGTVKITKKNVWFRKVPMPHACIIPNPTSTSALDLGTVYTFDASCTTFSDENPITKYSWKFRDGGFGDSILKSGILVQHAFSKPATTFEGAGCGKGGLEVELDLETKLHQNLSSISHYCIK